VYTVTFARNYCRPPYVPLTQRTGDKVASRDYIEYHQVGSAETAGERKTLNRMDLSIHNRRVFLGTFVVTQIPGLLSVILMLVWTINYRGGFSWGAADPGHAFNWHPLLMTIGMIYLYGNGALVYRVWPPMDSSKKMKLKMLHAATMSVVFVLMVIALKAAFDSHNLREKPIPNMYTLHSWVGLTASILFGIQWLSGLLTFLLPVAGAQLRANLLPFHQYYGSAIFAMVIAAALMGFLEKAIWAIGDYATKSGEGLLVNSMGMLIVVFGLCVTFMLSKFSKEKPL